MVNRQLGAGSTTRLHTPPRQVPRELACEVLLSRSGLWDSIRQDTAVLVTTPGLILSELIALQWQSKKFMETLGYFFGSNLNTLVLDECDSLFPAMPPGKNPRDMKGKYGPAERVIDFIFTVVRERYRNRLAAPLLLSLYVSMCVSPSLSLSLSLSLSVCSPYLVTATVCLLACDTDRSPAVLQMF